MTIKESVKISILKSEVVKSPFANGYCKKYYVQIKHNNKHFNITFHDSVSNYQNCKKLNKNDILYCVLSDMNCYEMALNEDDFIKEFGYNDTIESYKKGLKAYKACEETTKNMHELFTNEELEELQTEFENY